MILRSGSKAQDKSTAETMACRFFVVLRGPSNMSARLPLKIPQLSSNRDYKKALHGFLYSFRPLRDARGRARGFADPVVPRLHPGRTLGIMTRRSLESNAVKRA